MTTIPLIYDIGMHNGDDTAFYLQKAQRVVAVEANPTLAANATRRFADQLKAGRLVVVNKGIADRTGTMDFWINKTLTEWSSFSRETAGREGHPLQRLPVETVGLDELLRSYGMPEYMKIDIEGNDRHCLKALSTTNKPRYISLEFNGEELLDQLVNLGYGQFKCICQFTQRNLAFRLGPEFSWFEMIYTLAAKQNPMARKAQAICGPGNLWAVAREFEQMIKRDYVKGSSGPFGEETEGPWQDAQTTRKLYQQVKALSRERDSAVPVWCDLHAKA